MAERLPPSDFELRLKDDLVWNYLREGSVDAVMRLFPGCGISEADFHRELNRRGIVKSVGPNRTLSEPLYFFARLIHERIPLETLYRKLWRHLEISRASLYRILGYIKDGITSRTAVALVITTRDDFHRTLVGKDISTPRPELGKPFGALTIPACFSGAREKPETSILRVLQQEVLSELAIDGEIPSSIIPEDICPFMHLKIVDVDVSVFHIFLSEKDLGFLSSPKLTALRMEPVSAIIENSGENYRTGMKEIGVGYWNYLTGASGRHSRTLDSDLNLALRLTTSLVL